MAKADSIPAFPPDIDRDAFGHWLSGFVDGEGCFFLCAAPDHRDGKAKLPRPRAQFIITLRADDFPVLQQVHSFFQCGRAYITHKRSVTNPNSIGIFYCSTTADLRNVIVPHFDRYPLRAKKARDFKIFKEAVMLIDTVRIRPHTPRRRYTSLRGSNFAGGNKKWTDSERSHFVHLVSVMREQRSYNSELLQLEVPTLPEPDDFLFRDID